MLVRITCLAWRVGLASAATAGLARLRSTRGLLRCAMMFKAIAFLLTLTEVTTFAGELSPKDVVAQLYQAHRSKHDPLEETQLLSRYFDADLLKLYVRDEQEAKGEVGRLEVDPLYYAQDFEITNFTIAEPETVGGETQVKVIFKNLGERQRLVYVLTHTGSGWRISDVRYSDGSSLKKILERPLVPG